MSDTVLLDRSEDGIALLRMQDEENRNAFTEPFVNDLLAAFAEAGRDKRVKVILIAGLPDVWCAGAHRSLLLELAEGDMDASDILLSKALLDVPIPTIAAMEGHAVGGGLALALCCDVLLMARESRYGCSFMNMGFTPGMGITRLLQDAVGEYKAREMLLGGQMFKGSDFEATGVNYVLRRERVFWKAQQVAMRIAEKPRFALELLKGDLSLRHRQLFEQTRTRESAMHKLCFGRPETQALIRENYNEPT